MRDGRCGCPWDGLRPEIFELRTAARTLWVFWSVDPAGHVTQFNIAMDYGNSSCKIYRYGVYIGKSSANGPSIISFDCYSSILASPQHWSRGANRLESPSWRPDLLARIAARLDHGAAVPASLGEQDRSDESCSSQHFSGMGLGHLWSINYCSDVYFSCNDMLKCDDILCMSLISLGFLHFFLCGL